ncbi:MAG: CoA transferase [Archaeoglobaceae archaeon]|nr:CoA transferase [Archaeoglobaceae archaeon]
MTGYFDFIKNLIKNGEKREEPLKGVKVVEITHFIFGPNIGRILAQFGAEVVKIETPGEGDRFRLGTVFGRFYRHSNLIYAVLNTNKYFVAADARNAKAREIIFELARRSDVFVENLRAGLVDTMGIGYQQIRAVNPKIIYVSCSGYGQFGPLSKTPSFDVAAQGVSSLAMKTGWEDVDEFYKLPDYFGDFLPSMLAILAILAALYYREKTGKGQYIDISQTESLLRFLYDITYFSITRKEIGKTGNIDPTASPSGIFKTSDGKFVAISIVTEKQFEAIASVVGFDDSKKKDRFSMDVIKELNEKLEKWVEKKNLKEILEIAKEKGFPAAQVLDDLEVFKDPWRRERGSIVEVQDRFLGKVQVPGPFAIFSSTPGKIKWLARPVGYHNRLILKRWLNLSDEEIEKLEKDGAIGYWDEMPSTSPPPTWNKDDEVFRGEKDEG